MFWSHYTIKLTCNLSSEVSFKIPPCFQKENDLFSRRSRVGLKFRPRPKQTCLGPFYLLIGPILLFPQMPSAPL
ncbi:hypothetical protein ACFX13_009936 [Malus domestica]